MQFLTFNEDSMKSSTYTDIISSHLLISISDPNRSVNIPDTPHCKARLNLKFHDIIDIASDKISFNYDMAKEILDFVDLNLNQAELIVVNCQAGISRSVAVASALSKIINNADDNVFTKGIPNMLVYTTLLDAYFSTDDYAAKWSKIYYLRHQALLKQLTPIQVKLSEILAGKRKQEK